jgi:uncharacterized surface protein with fasciclin (FAS1) repeats
MVASEEPTVAPTGSIPASSAEPTKAPTKEPCSITEIVCDNPDFTYFCASLTATGIADKFDNYSGNYTVFAPRNSAFEDLGDAAIEYLMQPDNVDLLAKVLAFHSVDDKIIYSHDLTCQETIKMANGKDSRSFCRRKKLYQKGKGNSVEHRPEVVEVDIESCNGVIHVVNQVMLFDYPEKLGIPPNDAMVAPTGTVISPTLPPSAAPTVSKARNPVPCKTIGKCESVTAVGRAGLCSRNEMMVSRRKTFFRFLYLDSLFVLCFLRQTDSFAKTPTSPSFATTSTWPDSRMP